MAEAKTEKQNKQGKGPRKGGSYIKNPVTKDEVLQKRTAPAPTATEKAKAAKQTKGN